MAWHNVNFLSISLSVDENHACDLDEINWSNVPMCKEYKNFTMVRVLAETPKNC